MKKKAIVSVTNDLFSDQRVDKVCNSLTDMGFDVLLVGRGYRNSPELAPRRYRTRRLHLLFRKGGKFYAEYNLRLFFFLLFHKVDVLVSNDLDTLLPNFLVSRIKRKKIVYDSHEYFCGVPELVNRPRIRRVWHGIEKFCFPKLPDVITVNQSIADLYDAEYPMRKNKVNVVRNIPVKAKPPVTETKQSLGIPGDKKILILQGSGINVDRGAEELVQAMHWIENALLLIIGSGDIVPLLKKMVIEQGLSGKVRFIDRVPPDTLFNYTYYADVGFAIDKNTNLNYYYALPNKIFDFIKAGVPVIVSNLVEVVAIVKQYDIGLVIPDHNPETIAQYVNDLFHNTEQYNLFKENIRIAAQDFCWENEEKVLKKIYSAI